MNKQFMLLRIHDRIELNPGGSMGPMQFITRGEFKFDIKEIPNSHSSILLALMVRVQK